MVNLVPLEMEHLDDLFATASDPVLWKHIPANCSEKDRFMEVYRDAISDRAKGKQYPFVIYHKLSKKMIGSTRFFEIVPKDRKLEIGWTWIAREYWGSSVNPECKYLLLKFCFEVLSAARVQLKTDEQNTRSRKAIEKIGGVFEGILRKDRLKDNGDHRNAAYYSIIDEEWEPVKQNLENRLAV
jgi:RimJ/RimL family protein N-acetyltransferase